MLDDCTLRLQCVARRGLAILVSGLFLFLCAPAHADGTRNALRFEPNRGQFEADVRFVARGRSLALFLTDSGATLALQRSLEQQRMVVAMKIRGAQSREPRGLAQLPGKTNYFAGQDSDSWRSNVEAYARVRYEGVLAGVDVEYYGTEGSELEYDFVLAPGAAPNSIVADFDGISKLSIAADGSAQLALPDGSALSKRPPRAYQFRAGHRASVPVKYELRDGGLGFALGEYDTRLPLVIDPVLSYSTYFGGSSFDEALGVAADPAGNTYFVGYTASTLFPTSSPAQPSHGGGAYDAFIVKLNAAGTNMVYSTYIGGSNADMAYAVATDAQGNAYIAGLTMSTNFPSIAALQASSGGGQDAFVAKLNASGSALVYSTYLGGSADDYAKGIAVTGAGAAYVIGTTFSGNFPKAGALQASLNGSQDAFASQISATGSSLVYSTYLGGSGTESGNAIALDSSGSAYLVGSTTSANFPTLNARQPAFAGGGTDAFISKLNAAGTGFVYSSYWGGSAGDEALGVSVALNTAFVVGSTLSTDFPLALPIQSTPGGNNHSEAFITRFDPSGTSLIYSTYLGGTGNDKATAVAADSFGNAYVVGQTDSSDLPLQNPIDGQDAFHGSIDAFATAVSPNGARFAYTSYLGGSGDDHGTAVAVGGGRTHVLGSTRSTDFPKVQPIINGLVGAQDAFVVRIPSIEAVAAPAVNFAWLGLIAGGLLLVALLLLNARRPAHYRNAR